MIENDLSSMRRNYTKDGLLESLMKSSPFAQFTLWFQQAKDSGILEPNAMVLSTASKEGKPSARVVLLKDFGQRGFSFYSNYESHKAKDIEDNPPGNPFVFLGYFRKTN